MGFHNPAEVSTELHNALSLAQSARQNAEDALGAPCIPETEGPPGNPTCSDGIDNDCDTLIDGADPDCQVSECEGLNEQDCKDNPACRWKKKQGVCVDR
jgi:hypothetical protein